MNTMYTYIVHIQGTYTRSDTPWAGWPGDVFNRPQNLLNRKVHTAGPCMRLLAPLSENDEGHICPPHVPQNGRFQGTWGGHMWRGMGI